MSKAACFGRESAAEGTGDGGRVRPLAAKGLACALAVALISAVDPLSARNQPAAATVSDVKGRIDPFELAAWGIDPAAAREGGGFGHGRGSVEMRLRIAGGDNVEALLRRAGAVAGDSAAVAATVASALPAGVGPGAQLVLLFGDSAGRGRWHVEQVLVSDDWGMSLRIARAPGGGFAAATDAGAAGPKLRRVRGTTGDGLYWSLRSAAVPADAAVEYVSAIAPDAGGSRAMPGDSFDLVLAGDRLVYAALERRAGGSIQRVKWPVGEGTDWIDPTLRRQRSGGMIRPVAGRVSSRFGHRLHPILGFGRLHRGVDFAAPAGAPIRAAGDGIVVASGWNGGYGRQVRIAHAGGLQTSYSHMSAIAAAAGERIRAGQLVGYVGSSGFSTGPHLHYEVIAGGRPIDPLSTPHLAEQSLSQVEMARLRKRLRRLLSLEPGQALAS